MSYDISLVDPDSQETIELNEKHSLSGGICALGGTREAWLNVTYNYAEHFYRILGKKGIRRIYGMTGEESISVLQEAADMLGDDVDNDYWKSTEGNAKAALLNLIELAKLAPQGVWDGD